MRHAAVARSPFTSSMLDTLLMRWQDAAWLPHTASLPGPTPMAQARDLIAQTLGPCAARMDAEDRALYATLLTVADRQELRLAFYDCFDLMVRMRGPAIAMVRLRELHRLVG